MVRESVLFGALEQPAASARASSAANACPRVLGIDWMPRVGDPSQRRLWHGFGPRAAAREGGGADHPAQSDRPIQPRHLPVPYARWFVLLSLVFLPRDWPSVFPARKCQCLSRLTQS